LNSLEKEFVRRYAVKQKVVYKCSYREIKELILKRYKLEVSRRTLRRWCRRHREGWDFRNGKRGPKNPQTKITSEIRQWIVVYRQKTGYDSYGIREALKDVKKVVLSESTIKRIITGSGLSRGSKLKGRRLKWVRWQRDTPNSLWQMDHTEEFDKPLRLPVIDDCSRYLLSMRHFKLLTTPAVKQFLEELIKVYGKPRQILTDNASIYQKDFTKWCRRRGIEAIKSRVNKPTTLGKVERFHETYNRERHKYKSLEHFRYGYNTQRPHRSLDGKSPAEVYNEFHRLLFYKPQKPKRLRGGHNS